MSSAVMVVVLAAILYGFQQSVLDLTVWIDPFPLPSLVGPYLPNDLLAKANIFCGGECVAPESMAIDPTSGNVYARCLEKQLFHIPLEKGGIS